MTVSLGLIPQERQNKPGEPYDCPNLLPVDSFQATAKEEGTQTEPGALIKFRSLGNVRWPEFVRKSAGEKGAVERETERAKLLWGYAEGPTWVFGWMLTCTGMKWNSMKLKKKQPESSRWSNFWNLPKAKNSSYFDQSGWRDFLIYGTFIGGGVLELACTSLRCLLVKFSGILRAVWCYIARLKLAVIEVNKHYNSGLYFFLAEQLLNIYQHITEHGVGSLEEPCFSSLVVLS